MQTPKLYEIGRLNKLLNYKEVLETMFSAFVHSVILLMVIRFAYTGLDMVEIGDVWTFGTLVFTCLMLGVNYRLILITEAWNWIFWCGIVGGCVFPYVLFLIIYCSIPNWDVMNALPMFHVSHRMVMQPLFWLCLLTVPALAATMDLFKRFLTHTRCWRDREVDKAVEEGRREAARKAKAKGRDEEMPLNIPPKRQEDYQEVPQIERKNSSYDFDHSGRQTHPKQLGRTAARPYESGSEADERTPLSRNFPSGDLRRDDDYEEDSEAGFLDHIFQQEVSICWNCMSRDVQCLGVSCNPWRCSAACTFFMFLFLTMSGGSIMYFSSQLQQVRVVYDGKDAPQAWWQATWHSFFSSEDNQAQEHECAVHAWNESQTCHISVPIQQDIAGPVVVYYSLSPFYQNFADYFQSISWKELVGQDVSPRNAKYLKACRAPENRLTDEGYRISPCGMQANSMFNDSFEIDGMVSGQDIAWESDMRRFNNPKGYPAPNTTLWLYERYPSIISESEGVKNPHFAIWVRPDAYSEVRKPYGHIDRTLKKGEVLNITIHARYPIANVGDGVRKELVLTTKSLTLGGKDNSFGWFQLFFAFICFFTSIGICAIEFLGCDVNREDDEEEADELEDSSVATSETKD